MLPCLGKVGKLRCRVTRSGSTCDRFGHTAPRRPPVSTAQFVRPARNGDVERIVDLQVASWQALYGPLLPEEVSAEMASSEARADFSAQWKAALDSPPTSKHRLVVATDEVDGVRTVTGFAALGP